MRVLNGKKRVGDFRTSTTSPRNNVTNEVSKIGHPIHRRAAKKHVNAAFPLDW